MTRAQDVHYADAAAAGTRHYRDSLAKMKEATAAIAEAEAQFLIELVRLRLNEFFDRSVRRLTAQVVCLLLHRQSAISTISLIVATQRRKTAVFAPFSKARRPIGELNRRIAIADANHRSPKTVRQGSA